jgi:anthranilate synthase/indole-3-glycerol phosphate synthase/phosphoribosylanthranilate isomerase
LSMGSKVIGVNNRDLTSFEVDLGTTSRLMEAVPESTIVCALSGIAGPQDVSAYAKDGVKAVLVGEALMRAKNTRVFVTTLLGGSAVTSSSAKPSLSVKICGTRTPEAAKVAIEAGADYIGMILVPGRTRFVPDETALAISRIVKTTAKRKDPAVTTNAADNVQAIHFFEHAAKSLPHPDRALLVGVFLNATLNHIIEQVHKLSLDIVQLHGSEPLEWAKSIPVPVFRRFAPGEIGLSARGYHSLPLLDSGAGGSGARLAVSGVQEVFASDPSVRAMLAGGLTPENIAEVLENLGSCRDNIVAVDVSSGVETDGKQDPEKIVAFVEKVKGYRA